jgi:cytidylate kinase
MWTARLLTARSRQCVKSTRGDDALSAKRLIIAIDGPAGAGKSTIAKALARRLRYLYINTGAMYRALAWKALRDGVPLGEPARLGELAAVSKIELKEAAGRLRVFIDGCDVTDEISASEVTRAASIVSAVPAVRRALVTCQREIGRAGGVVMEGRDIGTKVFPQAEVKVFLDASASARSTRRHRQDARRGTSLSIEETKAEIVERDRRDSTRVDSPLVRAADAVYLDSSELSIDQVVESLLQIVAARQQQMGQT